MAARVMPESVNSIMKIAQLGFQMADWCMDAIALHPVFPVKVRSLLNF
ncbi:hypothetical protein H6F78_13240 [Coleofasciculus sp. FACHB-64]|nr:MULTISPECIES: hypothetical protein [unclassified Coleofasciculus]MBD1839703.1 hypothetical protein [Coleofasciculus sp. FACHB-501]MBD1943106.1 hypothetical protein [Coleofasciculus sp. FACHB-712]MBD2046545.1 hypothetical protein [Coleofasciculus sp. FACHB-64]MBD2540247.1 hypothetical protein [Coleofasciculus sp. FACHB-SPT36]